MTLQRKIGINIQIYLRKLDISVDDFSENLGYSKIDASNILEGKVIITPIELKKIADFFHITKSELINHELNQLPPNLYYVSEFQNPGNLDTILDLIDDYVYLYENTVQSCS